MLGAAEAELEVPHRELLAVSLMAVQPGVAFALSGS